jgi:hypothetical protein
MGLARDLSMARGRKRGKSPAEASDWAALRRLACAARPDLETFAAVLERTSPAADQPEWQFASRRYAELTG